jgi:hypothetical protein
MTKLNAATVYENLTSGASMTDEEVRYGVTYFSRLATTLAEAGPVFHLAFAEARRTATLCAGFLDARKRG